MNMMTAEEAVKLVKSGDRIYIGTASSVAYGLLDALWARREELDDVTLMGGLLVDPCDAICEKDFKLSTYFMGPIERKRLSDDRFDYTSFHLSQTDIWVKETARPDVAFFDVSLPDENGYMSYGAGGVALGSFVREAAATIILEINKNEPYVYGEKTMIHESEADAIISHDSRLPEAPEAPHDDTIESIAGYIHDQIPDGACVQFGIGSIANAVGYKLKDKNDLGAHTEIFTDSMMDLMKNGNLNNKHKNYLIGKAATGVAFGSKELYDFLDHNEDVYFLHFKSLNNPVHISMNANMISINSAVSIDLTGQVSSETVAGRQYSGTGGQLDYVKGAQMSKGGKSFIAVQSKAGENSRIVSAFPPGTVVTTTRSEVQYVVTEYGCVNLKPLTIRDRVRAMISLAHPDFRAQLKEEAKALGIL